MATTAMRSDSECATRTSISPLSSSWASSNGRDRTVAHPDVDEHIASRPDWPETQVEIEPLCCRTNRAGVQVGSCIRLSLQMPAHGVEPFRGQASCDHRPFVDRGHSLAWFTKAV